MIVKMRNRGRSVTGLQIGPRNVRRHFRQKVQSIELELGDVRIECELKPGFWRNQPEITDPGSARGWRQRTHGGNHVILRGAW